MHADPHSFLSQAHDRIALSWAQGTEARNTHGAAVDPWDADAASWSLLGALVAVYAEFEKSDSEGDALGALARACVRLSDTIDGDSLADWNDAPGRTQADVLAALADAASPS